MNGITVVRELAIENKHGSDVVMLGLNELTDNNQRLQQQSTSSKEMTTDISDRVRQVAGMIDEMVELTTESGRHAQNRSVDLEGLVKTAGTMAQLSSQVEEILQEFRTEFVTRLEDISAKMMAAMEETIRLIQLTLEKVTITGENVNKITGDSTRLGDHIQALMCELGVGGFMGVTDLLSGMKVRVKVGENARSFHGELLERKDNTLYLSLKTDQAFPKPEPCSLQVTVGNVIYSWESAQISGGEKTKEKFEIRPNSRPRILNRHKYPRMDVTNTCLITMQDSGETFRGTIIRCSDNDGIYIVGCQMPEDNRHIMKYVEENLKEGVDTFE